jgi:hypothetical protein
MVPFKVGGVPDLVRPGVTDYLAEPVTPGLSKGHSGTDGRPLTERKNGSKL